MRNKIKIIIIVSVSLVWLVLLPGLCLGAATNQISQFGITWTFDREYEYGQFANGDYWVVGPVTIVDINPPSINVGGRYINGAMVNPDQTNPKVGYDSAVSYGSYYYFDLNLNDARPSGNDLTASNPLVVPAGSSLIATISLDSTHPKFFKTKLKTAAILTVLASAPDRDNYYFRPSYAGTDKTLKFNKDQLNYNLLQTLSPVAVAMPIIKQGTGPHGVDDDDFKTDTVERKFERPWIDHKAGWTGDMIHPYNNMQDYGRDFTRDVSEAALILHSDLSGEADFADYETNDAYKETLLIRFVQLGIDNYGIYTAGGTSHWYPAGGHGSGRKWPILFAGLMLDGDGTHPDAASMKNIGSNPVNDPYFGEDGQTFYVAQSDIDMTHTPDPIKPTLIEYEQSDLGLPEWGIQHWLTPIYDNKWWEARYRTGSGNGDVWHGFILAAHIMGAKDLWNHDALFDYQDRHVSIQGIATTYWDQNMWATYRADYGCVWTRDDPTDIYSNGSNSCEQFFYGDINGNGEVTSYDAALVARYAVGLEVFTDEQRQKADVSGNGEISAYDAALIAQRAEGLIERFPVEEDLPSLSFTKLWNFLKGILTGKTGKAILTGKAINGNAVGDGEGKNKTLHIILSVLVVMILIIIIMIVKNKKNKKKSGKKIKRRR